MSERGQYSKVREESKKRILKTLKDFGRLSTTRIAGICALNYDYAKDYLYELKKEKKVKEMKETLAVYWELKK